MDPTIEATLDGWAEFYLITGTAAAALTGLQFVVQTLLATDTLRPVVADDPEASIAAFGSPTVVHFSLALLVSSVLAAPWPGYGSLRTTLAVLGAGALVYLAIVVRRARRQRTYHPVAEDWIWHVILPTAAYAAVLLAAMFLHNGAEAALFVVGAATLLLLFIGIHNAWDTVTFLTLNALRGTPIQRESAPPRRAHGRRRR